MTVKAVLFDLDGTLLDSIDGIVSCFEQVLAQYVPGHGFTRDQMIMKIGEPVPRQMLDFSGGRAELVDTMVAAYRTLMADMLAGFPLYPGAEPTLRGLKERGFKTGLVTSKSKGAVEVSFNTHGMADWFDVVVTANDTTIHKPHAEPLIYAANQLGISTRDILYIGDSVHDIRCAHAAGSYAGAAYWGPFPWKVLDDLKPICAFESLPDILQLFASGADQTLFVK